MSSKTDEINISKVIKKIQRNKSLILLPSLIFMFFGFIYGSVQPKIFKTEVVYNKAPAYSFVSYAFLFDYEKNIESNELHDSLYDEIFLAEKIAEYFNKEFKINLLSIDNLNLFFEQNNKIDSFKLKLKKKKIASKEYFREKREKFRPVFINKNNHNKFFLFYEKPLQGNEFLNDYLLYTKRKTELNFIKQMSKIIEDKLNIYDQNLRIAKKIDLENPVLVSLEENKKKIYLGVEPKSLFYKGTKVLNEEIKNLNIFLNKLKNFNLDYDIYLEKSSSSYIVSKSSKFFVFIGLVVGLIFSLFTLFIRSNLR